MEEKHEKFVRIAEKRTNKILEQIRLLGNCSNRNNYSYSEEEIKKIFGTIENELHSSKIRFSQKKQKEQFKL